MGVEQTTSSNAAMDTSGIALLQKTMHLVKSTLVVGEDGAGQNKVLSSDSGKVPNKKALLSDKKKSHKKAALVSVKKKTHAKKKAQGKKKIHKKKKSLKKKIKKAPVALVSKKAFV